MRAVGNISMPMKPALSVFILTVALTLGTLGACSDSPAHLIEADGWGEGGTFSTDGKFLLTVYRTYREGYEHRLVADSFSVYEVGTWRKKFEYKSPTSWGCLLQMCADHDVMMFVEYSEIHGGIPDLVLHSISRGEDIVRIKMPEYWCPYHTYCSLETNTIYVNIFPGRIIALDGSTGDILQEYIAVTQGDYAPFYVQESEDRLVWNDRDNEVIRTYRLSTGELLDEIVLWFRPFTQWFTFMGDDIMAFGTYAEDRDGETGRFLVLVDLSEGAIVGEHFLGDYELGGLILMDEGSDVLMTGLHDLNGKRELWNINVKTSEMEMIHDIGYLNWGIVWPITELDLLMMGDWSHSSGAEEYFYLYSYPDFELLGEGSFPSAYEERQYVSSRKLVAMESYFNDHFAVFDPQGADLMDDFYICHEVRSDSLRVNAFGRWAAVGCGGEDIVDNGVYDSNDDHPRGSGVAVVDLNRYAKNVPECESHDRMKCGPGGDVHWYDSCGGDEGVALECDDENSTGCENLSDSHAACVCKGNWARHTGCRACRGNFDPSTDCTTCKPHWVDEENLCRTCPVQWDRLYNCAECVNRNRDPGTDCAECLNGWYGDECRYWGCTGEIESGAYFAPPVVHPADGGVGPAVTADFDGDGNTDVAVIDNGMVVVYGGTGDFFSDPQVFFTEQGAYGEGLSGGSIDLLAGDFDGDGATDLLALNGGDDWAGVLPGDETGFGEAIVYDFCEWPEAIVVADFDSDDCLDLAVACPGDETVKVFLGDGAFGFDLDGSYPTMGLARQIVSEDFDGDGVMDLAATTEGYGVEVMLGNGSGGGGDGSFSEGVFYPIDTYSTYLELLSADFDGDEVPSMKKHVKGKRPPFPSEACVFDRASIAPIPDPSNRSSRGFSVHGTPQAIFWAITRSF